MNEVQIKTYAKELILVTTFACGLCLLVGFGTIYMFPDLINKQYFPEYFTLPDYMKVVFFNTATFWAGIALGVVGMVDKLLRKSGEKEVGK